MFICPKCKADTALPKCESCGYEFPVIDGIYQFTDMPNLNLDDSNADKYIGYDKPGKYYEGKNYLECDNYHKVCAEKISELTGDGIFFDLACGGGSTSVPVLLNGTKVISGDISTVMLRLLREKAIYNNAEMKNISICRMNAYDIPLTDNTVDCAMANSMLHLLSNPLKVINELYRVIKPNGLLIFEGNSPGIENKIADELNILNKNYMAAVGDFHRLYWEKANTKGFHRTEYSWEFDQIAACGEIFSNKSELNIDFYEENITTLKDDFLYRMSGKGFSDQQGLPDEIHNKIFNETLTEMKNVWGSDFDKIEAKTLTNGITLHIFKK